MSNGEWTPDDLKPCVRKMTKAGLLRMITNLANVVNEYSLPHPFLIGDCALCKLNMTDRRPRPAKKASSPKGARKQ